MKNNINAMLGILDENKDVLDGVNINKIKNYVNLISIVDELNEIKERLFEELTEDEKYTIDTMMESVIRNDSVVMPKYLKVRDVAEILDLPTQEVRKECAEGKLICLERQKGSHMWLIETSQFIGHPNLNKVLEKKEENRKKSLKFVKSMIQLINGK